MAVFLSYLPHTIIFIFIQTLPSGSNFCEKHCQNHENQQEHVLVAARYKSWYKYKKAAPLDLSGLSTCASTAEEDC